MRRIRSRRTPYPPDSGGTSLSQHRTLRLPRRRGSTLPRSHLHGGCHKHPRVTHLRIIRRDPFGLPRTRQRHLVSKTRLQVIRPQHRYRPAKYPRQNEASALRARRHTTGDLHRLCIVRLIHSYLRPRAPAERQPHQQPSTPTPSLVHPYILLRKLNYLPKTFM